jgi:hypothetical protein
VDEDFVKTFLMFGVALFAWMIIFAKVVKPRVPLYSQLTN